MSAAIASYSKEECTKIKRTLGQQKATTQEGILTVNTVTNMCDMLMSYDRIIDSISLVLNRIRGDMETSPSLLSMTSIDGKIFQRDLVAVAVLGEEMQDHAEQLKLSGNGCGTHNVHECMSTVNRAVDRAGEQKNKYFASNDNVYHLCVKYQQYFSSLNMECDSFLDSELQIIVNGDYWNTTYSHEI